MWYRRDREALRTLLDETMAHIVREAALGHQALAQQLETNKSLLLERLTQVDGKVDKIDGRLDALGGRVEQLSIWRTRLEGIATGGVGVLRYLALPVIAFLLYLLYQLVVVKLFPGLKV